MSRRPASIHRIEQSRATGKGPSFPGRFQFRTPGGHNSRTSEVRAGDEDALLAAIEQAVNDPASKLTVSFRTGEVFAEPAKGLGQGAHVLTFTYAGPARGRPC